MKRLFLLFLISNSVFCNGQETPNNRYEINTANVYAERDVLNRERDPLANFPGGWRALIKYVHMNFDWGCVNLTDSIIESSKVYLSFIVEKDGSISNVSVDRGINSRIDKCCIDFIKRMPKWNPSTNISGMPVAQKIRLPITLNLGNSQ